MMFPPEIEKAIHRAEKRASFDRSGLYPVSMAASLAYLHPATIRRWIREGRVPVYGWRGAFRVRVEDLLPEFDQDGGK